MKNSITTHFLGTKGLAEKDIKDYYKNLKDIRQAISKGSIDVQVDENLFEIEGGLRFFYQEWQSPQKSQNKPQVPKCIVFAFHDAYGSSDIFYPLADQLCPLGALVVSLDYRGHGRTGGQAGGNLGDLPHLSEIYEDIFVLAKKYKLEYNIPIYLLGFDIGALIAVQIASKYSELGIEGLILISPIWKLKKTIKHLLLYPIISIGNSFSKGKPVQTVLEEPTRTTYYEEYKKLMENDPLRLKMMSLRLFKKLLDLINTTPLLIRKMKLPLVVFQSTDDTIVDHFAVHKMYDHWPHPNKKIRLYENAGHNLLMDRFTVEMYKEIAQFLGI